MTQSTKMTQFKCTTCAFAKKCPFVLPALTFSLPLDEVQYCPKKAVPSDDPNYYLFLSDRRVEKLSRFHLN